MKRNIYNDYARQIVLRDIGLEGQEKLLKARVAIIGMGGLGSPAAMILAAMGVGYLRIVDRDVVSITDLHRQPLYRRGDVDKPKVQVAEERLREINPWLEIDPIPEPITEENIDRIVSGVDVILDGLDNMRPRYIVNRAAVKHRVPYIFASAIEMYGNISTIIPYETPCLECFYGGLEDANLPSCAQVGVHPSLTHMVASLAVSEAVRILIGTDPVLKNTLLYVDLKSLSLDKIRILRNEKCPVCGSSPLGKPKSIKLDLVEVSCARDGTGIIFINNLKPDLDLEFVVKRIIDRGYRISNRSSLSVSFEIDENLSGVLLKSGVMVGKVRFYSEGIERRLLDIYNELLGTKLNID